MTSASFHARLVRVLKARVHALPAHRTVDVCGVAKHEAAAIAEALGAAMMDAVHGEPMTRRERQAGSAYVEGRGDQILEGDVVFSKQVVRQDADHTPPIGAFPGGVQVGPAAPQEDGQLVCHHMTYSLPIS